MKSKLKIILTIILLIITITVSNIGQYLLSNEQFKKENSRIGLKE